MPGTAHAEWRSQDVVRRVNVRAGRGLDAAGRIIAGSVAEVLGVTGGGVPSPPGKPPRRQSGQLRSAVGSQRMAPDVVHAGIVRRPSELPKAVRLARGFVGTDSLGRRYNQRTRNYIGPAFRRVNNRLMPAFVKGAK